MKPRSIRRAAQRVAEKPKSIEARAAEVRTQRQQVCAKEFRASTTEVLKRHNCRMELALEIAGQIVPLSQVLSCKLVIQIVANVEEPG